MSKHNPESRAFSDLERPHSVVADSVGDTPQAGQLAVRLGDLWSEFIRVADEARDPDAPKKASAVPLLDDMKGIQQWD